MSVGEGETRAYDAERAAAASMLNEAFAQGRLNADEHGQRLSLLGTDSGQQAGLGAILGSQAAKSREMSAGV